MEITHSKGTLYPALQLSSFRVRKHALPSDTRKNGTLLVSADHTAVCVELGRTIVLQRHRHDVPAKNSLR